MQRKNIYILMLCILLISLSAESVFAAGFYDVPKDSWYAASVQFISENGIMSGVGGNAFDPDGIVTRGMLAVILYRMEHSPAVFGSSSFADVAKGSYCENAVIWASKNGIVNGYSTTQFGPNDSITREQFAVMLYRYVCSKHGETNLRGSLRQYKDVEKISDYAKNAMLWANVNGLITGTSGTELSPKAPSTRAQAAAIISRYIKSYDSIHPVEEQVENPDGNAKFIVDNVEAKAGDCGVKIRVAVKNNPGIASIGMSLTFDEDLILTAVDYNKSIGGEFMPPANQKSPVHLTWISPFKNVADDWTFAVLSFDVSKTAKSGTHRIAVNYNEDNVYNLNEDNVFFEVIDGSLTVSDK